MPIGYTIRIEHRHQHKDKIFPEEKCPMILLIKQEFYDPSHGIAGRSFYGMNTPTDKYDWLIIPEFNHFFVAQSKHRIWLDILKAFLALMRR